MVLNNRSLPVPVLMYWDWQFPILFIIILYDVFTVMVKLPRYFFQVQSSTEQS